MNFGFGGGAGSFSLGESGGGFSFGGSNTNFSSGGIGGFSRGSGHSNSLHGFGNNLPWLDSNHSHPAFGLASNPFLGTASDFSQGCNLNSLLFPSDTRNNSSFSSNTKPLAGLSNLCFPEFKSKDNESIPVSRKDDFSALSMAALENQRITPLHQRLLQNDPFGLGSNTSQFELRSQFPAKGFEGHSLNSAKQTPQAAKTSYQLPQAAKTSYQLPQAAKTSYQPPQAAKTSYQPPQAAKAVPKTHLGNQSEGFTGPKNWEQVKEMVKGHEGIKPNVYTCSAKFLTLGYGHKLTEADKLKWRKNDPVPREVADHYFEQDFPQAKDSVMKRYPHYPTEVQFILTDMTFQMGNAGVARFKKMHEALERKDYEAAAQQMEDSKWFRDIKSDRPPKLIRYMRSLNSK